MKKLIPAVFTMLLLCSAALKFSADWGFYAHRKINYFAVFTLPQDLFGFYKKHIEYISENAVNPDKRRYAVKGEAERHYIDIDHYARPGEDPFEIVPKRWDDAVALLTEDTLHAYGILPWHIPVMVFRLTRAFQENDHERILRLSADLGHYIGDAHVPLHTTKNYNGQYTGQYGIHGFWESRLPELYDQDYNFFVGKAEYIDDVQEFTWKIIKESHYAVDSVLRIEKELDSRYPADQKYGFEERGRTVVRAYSQGYAQEYHELLNGMVERRMRSSVHALGCLWFTAWVNAGQPSLGMNAVEFGEEYLQEMKNLELEYNRSDKPIGRNFED